VAYRILIAEDEPSIVISIEFLMREAGYDVTVASNGTDAIDLAEKLQPDLVVLDVMLPEVNGFEVCRRIREGRATQGVRVLMLTAHGRESEMEKGLAAGANAYMTKPFSTKELVDTVADLLGAVRPA
jgi:DNA-binding response OmpR family regulator